MSPNTQSAIAPLTALEIPENVVVGAGSVILGGHAFKRFKGRRMPAVTIGSNSTMDGVHFAVGPAGEVRIGDTCFVSCAILMCELEISIGSYVVIGWNVSIGDSDFHPLSPAQRIADAIACSPHARTPRPADRGRGRQVASGSYRLMSTVPT